MLIILYANTLSQHIQWTRPSKPAEPKDTTRAAPNTRKQRTGCWWIQDGAPCHGTIAVRHLLTDVFNNSIATIVLQQ